MKGKLNLEYLEAFIMSAETGRFNLTAELTFKSHSSISVQIKNLERHLDTISS